MFGYMIKIAEESGYWSKKIDVFVLIKRVRIQLSKCDKFTELIKNQEFPVTIGISAFNEKILPKMK
jgi:hypothetical protein